MKEYELYTLSNGIRVVHKQVTNTRIAHCGFILDIGSRDEKPDQQGLAHFWEHMAFKGTQKRKAFHILNRLETVGGELNAYTTKEKICFYASVLDNFFENALELLTDITFDSIFPEKQIERERNVILEEMSMYHDAPEDAIQDEFDNIVFKNHPLGNNILGTAESVRSFHRDDFKKFIFENLDTEKVVFSCVANLPLSKVVKLLEKHVKDIARYSAKRDRLLFTQYLPDKVLNKRQISQAHCAIGKTAYSIVNENRLPFFMLVNILGGPGMNSRLNLALREKHGFVYSIDANYTPFIDTGLFGIYFGTEKKQLDKSIQLVLREVKKLREVQLGTLQLHRGKEQLMGQLAMAEESNLNFMLMMGKSMLDLDKIEPLNEIFSEIKNITSKKLLDIANESLQENDLSILTFLPQKAS
ncbi:MAG TPA: pitrilysin family protein [Cytophagales bacterium]|nr:pitrilysin family protein [Cytophagales bacterium]